MVATADSTRPAAEAAHLRRFRWRDFWPVYALVRAVFQRDAFGIDLLCWRALTCRGGFFVAARGDELIGFCLTRRSAWRRRGEVVGVAVRADSQGRGWGRRLMEETIRFMRQHGMRELTLEVAVDNERAQRLYRALGFVLHEHLPDYYGTGRHGWRMRLLLEGA